MFDEWRKNKHSLELVFENYLQNFLDLISALKKKKKTKTHDSIPKRKFTRMI